MRGPFGTSRYYAHSTTQRSDQFVIQRYTKMLIIISISTPDLIFSLYLTLSINQGMSCSGIGAFAATLQFPSS